MSVDLAVRGPAAPAPIGRARRRLRVLATGPTTPDRLRRLGAVLVVGCLVTAAAGLAGAVSRTDAVAEGGTRIAALRADAAQLYRSLADADAMATSGYVSGGLEPAAVRARYDDDIGRAADGLAHAAGLLPADDPGAAAVATIAAQLPVYTGLVETARTYNRQGLPLGQSYLDNASRLMRSTMLPAAAELRRQQDVALAAAYDRGGAVPFAVLLLGVAVLAALVDASMRERRRTNRMLSAGLLVAGAAVVLSLLWWAVATAVASDRLADAQRHGAATTALDEARTAVLQARSNESLVLVARSGGSASDEGFTAHLDRVLGTGADPGLLAAAASSAGPDAAPRIDAARAAARQWQEAHGVLRDLDDGGQYPAAVASATGADPAGSGAAFERVDAALGVAVEAERQAGTAAADAAGGALTGLAGGPTGLALLAAGAVVAGIGRRAGEYR